jgi:hypothetical protein
MGELMASAWDATPAAWNGAGFGAGSQSAWDSTPALDPTEGMSGVDKFRAGMGKAFADIGLGAGQLIPVVRNGHLDTLVTRADVADARKLDAPLMQTGAAKWGNLAGSLALGAPAMFVPGANTIGGSAAIGAAYGLLAPSTSTGETMHNVGWGAGAGALVPTTITGLKTAKAALEPLYSGGRDQIVGRTLLNASGQDADALVNALQAAKSRVPGVQYTVAEATQNPGLAAMQRTATQTTPVVSSQAATRQAANDAARVGALADLAGTQGERDLFGAARQAAASDQYSQAFKTPINYDSLTSAQQGEIDGLMKMPAVQDAVRQARTNAANMGMDLSDPAGSIGGLHQAKLAMDDQISRLINGSAAEVNKANGIRAAQDRLVSFMDDVQPLYGEARATYESMSNPINQMDTMQRILDKSTNPLTGTLYPQSFARAATDDAARQATGFPRATLDNTLSPDAQSTLDAVKDDLVRQNFMTSGGRGPGSDTVQKLAYSNLLDQSGMPNWIRNFTPADIVGGVAQRAGDMLYGGANKSLTERLAQALLDPNDASGLVQSTVVSPSALQLADLLRRLGAAGGAATPEVIQANQLN